MLLLLLLLFIFWYPPKAIRFQMAAFCLSTFYHQLHFHKSTTDHLAYALVVIVTLLKDQIEFYSPLSWSSPSLSSHSFVCVFVPIPRINMK